MAIFKKKNTTQISDMILNERDFICENMNFGASEAYKMLRINIQTALGKSKGCKVIGITSSNNSEGKSLCSINTAYTLSLTGAKVLLIDGDMRVPTISKYLDLKRTPGLRELLKGTETKVVQGSGVSDTLKIIAAGNRPINPSELIGSEAMENSIKVLSQSFDYIIFDLPPVNEVSDAITLSRFLDGLLLVVHQDLTTKKSLRSAMTMLNLAHANVLGFVLVDSNGIDGKYSKNAKYGKFGKFDTSSDSSSKYASVYEDDQKETPEITDIGEVEKDD